MEWTQEEYEALVASDAHEEERTQRRPRTIGSYMAGPRAGSKKQHLDAPEAPNEN